MTGLRLRCAMLRVKMEDFSFPIIFSPLSIANCQLSIVNCTTCYFLTPPQFYRYESTFTDNGDHSLGKGVRRSAGDSERDDPFQGHRGSPKISA
jgi:hypothetical protein